MTLTLHDLFLGRNEKTALLMIILRGERSFYFMVESPYYNKVGSAFFIPCSSLLRA